ncbi:DUF3077 domain-containing protein [Solimonas terrae]|uniref:DUF3077 domain-containing protein n=1 Tax=Solimonas terrae TaxID=1396819 RepID=A0A6M2BMS0_9GAMM|nr:DUF3077 domain-containing protein [Solimonas terrae]NGY03455.1 DUF3077 domain-containing protein [Solimonas terrae]
MTQAVKNVTPEPVTTAQVFRTVNCGDVRGQSFKFLLAVNGGVPIGEALQQASNLSDLAGDLALTAGGALTVSTEQYACAAHFLAECAKAITDACQAYTFAEVQS